MSLDTVLGNFPTARRQMSSAYPCAYRPPPQSLANRSSTTRHHRRGDSTPPCGHPLDTATLLEKLPSIAVAWRPSRMGFVSCQLPTLVCEFFTHGCIYKFWTEWIMKCMLTFVMFHVVPTVFSVPAMIREWLQQFHHCWKHHWN